jgi:hypothetical protein
MDHLRNHVEDIQQRADCAESKLGSLMGKLAEEKYRSQELGKREKHN